MRPLCLFTPVLLSALWASNPLEGAEAKPKNGGSDDLFSPPQTVELKIEMGNAAVEALRQAPKDYVKVTITEGVRVYANAGLRYRGSNGPASKPGFTVKFNEFVNGQRFHGQSKIMLENPEHDPSYLSALVASELFHAAGVPAPRQAFARVELNGKDLGLYLLSEGVNKDFLGRHFERAKGNLYEGDHNDVTDKLDKDSGDDHKDQPDLQALANAARESDPAQRWQRLQKLLDVERFTAFLATEVLTWHTAGYALKTNKYRVYHDPTSDKMVFIPHGLEVAFTKVDGPLFPDMAGLVARAVLQAPEGKRLYRERMARLLSGPAKADAIPTRLNEMAARIRPVLTKSDPAAAKGLDAAVAQLREHIAQRAYFLEQELKKSQ
jgi:hypothetical protein